MHYSEQFSKRIGINCCVTLHHMRVTQFRINHYAIVDSLAPAINCTLNYNNNNGRNGSFLRGWLPPTSSGGKAQMACNYCFPTRTMFEINSEF